MSVPCFGCDPYVAPYPLVPRNLYGDGKDGWFDQREIYSGVQSVPLNVFPQANGSYIVRGYVLLNPLLPLPYTAVNGTGTGVITLNLSTGVTVSESAGPTSSTRTRTATGGGTGTWTYTDAWVKFEITLSVAPPDGTTAWITVNYPALYTETVATRQIVAQIYDGYDCEPKFAELTACNQLFWGTVLNCPINLCETVEAGLYIDGVLIATLGQDGLLHTVSTAYSSADPITLSGWYTQANLYPSGVQGPSTITAIFSSPGIPCSTNLEFRVDGVSYPMNGTTVQSCTYTWDADTLDFDNATQLTQLVINGVNVLTDPVTVTDAATLLAALNALNVGTFELTGTTVISIENVSNVFGVLTVNIGGAQNITPTVECI